MGMPGRASDPKPCLSAWPNIKQPRAVSLRRAVAGRGGPGQLCAAPPDQGQREGTLNMKNTSGMRQGVARQRHGVARRALQRHGAPVRSAQQRPKQPKPREESSGLRSNVEDCAEAWARTSCCRECSSGPRCQRRLDECAARACLPESDSHQRRVLAHRQFCEKSRQHSLTLRPKNAPPLFKM